MVKIRIMSDLHLEFNEPYPEFTEKADYLILAGDIVDWERKEELLNLFDKISKEYKEIFYILGNHEYYLNPYSEKEEVLRDYKNICATFPNVHLLENETFEIKELGVKVFGATLWAEYKDSLYTNDLRYLPLHTIKKKHKTSVETLKNLDQNSKYIIITHHIPSFKLIAAKYRKQIGAHTCYASNTFDSLNKDSIRLWVYGHTHDAFKGTLDGVSFVCNPRGYPEENAVYTDFIVHY